MYFRPFPFFTLFCLTLFLALIALGVWQIERLHWKLGLIAEMRTHLDAPPIAVDQALGLPDEQAQFRHVILKGRYDNTRETYVYTTARNGAPVYHVIVPFVLDDGRVFMLDRGLVPLPLRDPRKRPRGLLFGERTVVGVWRTPDRPGAFTPKPDVVHRIWYARDIGGITQALGVKPAAPVLIEADPTPVPGRWPLGGQTVVSLPNDHLQYALTWFLLAGGLAFVYFAYHRAQGRLGLRN